MGIERWFNQNYNKLFSSKPPIFQQDVESKPSPAPVKGWDAISPLSNMEPDFAVILDNIVSRPGWVEIRGGYNAWCQGLGGPVESIMVYRPANAPEVMFSVAGGVIWDTSVNGSQTISLTGLTSNKLQYINFDPLGVTSYLIAVNGVDTAGIFDGVSWAPWAVTGIATSSLININAHKRRIWAIEKNSTSAWYLATDAIAGALTEFNFGSLLTKGSFLVAMGTWTVDGGLGPDDYAIFITNKGQVLAYKGTDPGNADAWFLVGVFNLPPPIGSRCLAQMGSDLLIITLEGLLPISKALPFDPSGVRSVALTNRIQNAMSGAAQSYRENFGWETNLFPLQTLLLLNIPVDENTAQMQFVMNTLTGAWCKFTGWNANTFAIFNESLFFGDNDGSVHLAYAGGFDLVDSINMDIKCAYNYYDDPGRIKIMQLCRPFIVSDGIITPTLGVDVDFGDSNFAANTSVLTPVGGEWDSGIWDDALWATNATASVNWQTVGAIGTALAIRMKLNILGSGTAGSNIITSSVFDTGVFDTAIFDGNGAVLRSGQGVPVLQINQFEVVIEHGAVIG